MADKRISQLVDRGTVANNDVVPIVVSGATTTNKATISSIQTFMQGNLDVGVTSVGITLGSTGTDVNVSGSPVTSSGNITINIPTASAVNRGALSSADWTTFNSKQQAITLTTTGTSGAATLVSGALNIPNYSTDLSGYVTLGTTQTITAQKTFTTSGSSDTMIISHGSGSGFALDVLKAGNGEAIRVTKSSGSGNAMTISGGNFEAPTIVKTGGTSSQFLKADGSVDSSTYLTTASAGTTYVPYTGAGANVDLGIYNLTANAVNVNASGSNAGVINLESNTIFSLVNGYGTIGSGTTNQFNFYQTTGAGVFRGAILSLNSITASATRTYTFPDADGTLALTSQIPANPVGGTGAAGRVAYWNGSGTITSDSLFQWNDTFRRLGIGCTPTVSLDVVGAGALTGALSVGGALNGTSASFSSTTEASNASTASVVLAGGLGVAKNIRTSQNIIAEGVAGTIATLNGGDFQVYTSGNANYSSISSPSSGNMVLKVNIGATPINALTLASTGAATFSSSVGINGATTNFPLTVKVATNQNLRISTETHTAVQAINDAVNAFVPLKLDGSSLLLNTQSGGSVGIGTASPTAKLQITSTSAGAATIGLFLNNNSATSNTETRIAFAANTNDDISNNRYSYISALNTSGSNGQALIFATNETGGAGTERMRVTQGGRVGIGQTSPGIALSVAGQSEVWQLGVTSVTGTAGALIGSPSANTLAFGDWSGNERMRITSGGYLKASNDGTYNNSGASYHELRNSANQPSVFITNTKLSGTEEMLRLRYTNLTSNSSDNWFIYADDSTTARFYVRSDGGIGNFQANNVNLSDERVKKDIEPLESYWDKFKAIEIVKFKYKDQTHDDFNIGVIAQQVEAVAPEFVDVDGWGNKPELDEEGNEIVSEEEPLKSIYTADLHHAAIKVLQEAMAKIEKLETEIDSLKNQIK